MRNISRWGLLPAVLLVGCSASDGTTDYPSPGNGGSQVGGGGSGKGGSTAGQGGSVGGSSLGGGTGSGSRTSNALSAHIERGGIKVQIVTLSCSGECADVVAVPSGGFDPYTFTWEDGSTNPARHVCPTATTSYEVTVTDEGRGGEFPVASQTVRAPLTAEVLTCPPPQPDGGSPPTGFCFQNGTFAAPITGGTELTGFNAPNWVGCVLTPDIFTVADLQFALGAGVLLPPTDGLTYLGLYSDTKESVGQTLCGPLKAGEPKSIKLDAFRSNGSPAKVTIYGSTSSCGLSQKLWESPPLEASWQTYCATLAPTSDVTHLVVESSIVSGFGNGVGRVLVDNMVQVDSCP